MSRNTLAGAAALLSAPVLAIVATLIQPTMSGDAADQFSAISGQRGATITALVLDSIAIALLIGGAIWFAATLARHNRRLALAGGVLAVFGALVVLFEYGVAAAAPAVVRGLDPASATAALDHINSSSAVSGLEPVSILGDIGLAMLGIAAVRIGAPRWSGAAIAVGALGEGIGFATESRALVIAGFAVLLAGLVQAVVAQVGVQGARWYHRDTLEEGSGGAASKRLFQL